MSISPNPVYRCAGAMGIALSEGWEVPPTLWGFASLGLTHHVDPSRLGPTRRQEPSFATTAEKNLLGHCSWRSPGVFWRFSGLPCRAFHRRSGSISCRSFPPTVARPAHRCRCREAAMRLPHEAGAAPQVLEGALVCHGERSPGVLQIKGHGPAHRRHPPP